MVLTVSKPSEPAHNKFNLIHASLGWVNSTTTYMDRHFSTSEFIPVTAGDVLCFGAAVTGQGWHLVTYNAKKQPVKELHVLNGIVVLESLDDLTAIMKYTVEDGINYVRMVCDHRYLEQYMVTKDRIFTADEYRAWISSSVKPGELVKKTEQTLDCWTVILNVQGSGIMTVGSKTFSFAPGTIVCIPPDTPFGKVARDGFVDLYVNATTFSTSQQDAQQLIITEDDKNQSVKTIMQLMLRVYWESADHNQQLLEQLYDTIQQIIVHRLLEQQMYDPQVNRLIQYMNTSFTDPHLQMDDVFAKGDYCPNHLRRLFKKATGSSPLEYLINLRIDHAKKLIHQNEYFRYSVTRIAALSGFDDISYFSRLFKKKVGMSPMRYMKNFTSQS